MTRGASPMSIAQKEIIRKNMKKMFPVNICKQEGMEGTTTRQIADYIRSLPERVDAEMVVWTLETWIEKHGLKAEFGKVLWFIRDLKKWRSVFLQN